MPDQYDPYREPLVIERETVWPPDGPNLDPQTRRAIEDLVHSRPQLASQLVYVRLFTGFCRRIILAAEEVERLLAELAGGQTAKHNLAGGEGPEEKGAMHDK